MLKIGNSAEYRSASIQPKTSLPRFVSPLPGFPRCLPEKDADDGPVAPAGTFEHVDMWPKLLI